MKKSKHAPLLSGPGWERTDRLASLIREEVNVLILRELELPKGVLITMTQVKVFGDLSGARIGISVLPADRGKEIIKLMDIVQPHLQRILNQKLKSYRVPKIEFYLDESIERGEHIVQILDKVKQGE